MFGHQHDVLSHKSIISAHYFEAIMKAEWRGRGGLGGLAKNRRNKTTGKVRECWPKTGHVVYGVMDIPPAAQQDFCDVTCPHGLCTSACSCYIDTIAVNLVANVYATHQLVNAHGLDFLSSQISTPIKEENIKRTVFIL